MNIFIRPQCWLNSATLQNGISTDLYKDDHLYFYLPGSFVHHRLCVYSLWSAVIFSNLHNFIVDQWHRSVKWFFLESSYCLCLILNEWVWILRIFWVLLLVGWVKEAVVAWLLENKSIILFLLRNFCKFWQFSLMYIISEPHHGTHECLRPCFDRESPRAGSSDCGFDVVMLQIHCLWL